MPRFAGAKGRTILRFMLFFVPKPNSVCYNKLVRLRVSLRGCLFLYCTKEGKPYSMDLSMLNKEQRAAVECLEGPLLVLAGAGSGKTRVLTYRIANLIEHGVKPWNILALTFTNKAAAEMRERAAALIGTGAEEMWVTTFHSCCAKILRIDCGRLGYERNFTIYDDGDQLKVIGDILKDMGMNDKNMPKREMKERISNAKNRSLAPEQFLEETYADSEKLTLRVYRQYEKRLRAANALDFDDLLVKTLALLEGNQDILEKYRDKFKYVLVDEYQDTNMPQYRLVELLCREHRNICVVGDDDQSIYGWRGADLRNIMSFEKDFGGAEVIRLEQNYRSTSKILGAANAVIANNKSRKRKTLWTAQEGGEPIEHYIAASERDEANFICHKILEGIRDGRSYSDFAILYRMNAQSRVLEGTLLNYGIPHKVYGGFRFYERKEIQDILAYLRLIANPSDDVALMRIINVPRRGIGEKAVNELRLASETQGLSMLFAAMDGSLLTAQTARKLKGFTDCISELMALCAVMPLSSFVEHLIQEIRYEAYLQADDKKGELEARMDNLRELIGNIKEIERDLPEGENALNAFLENVALISDIDAMEEGSSTVALMTLHSAKGLEFPVVFLAGMEENVFPTFRARMDMTQGALEEERRLCYVGITRAREKLYLIHAQQRSLFGDSAYNPPSRFIAEIPEELIECQQETRAMQQRAPWRRDAEMPKYASAQGFGIRRDIAAAAPAATHHAPEAAAPEWQLKPFMRVRHEKFGEGTVLETTGSGNAMTVTVDFASCGVKRFAAAYAPLTPVEE